MGNSLPSDTEVPRGNQSKEEVFDLVQFCCVKNALKEGNLVGGDVFVSTPSSRLPSVSEKQGDRNLKRLVMPLSQPRAARNKHPLAHASLTFGSLTQRRAHRLGSSAAHNDLVLLH